MKAFFFHLGVKIDMHVLIFPAGCIEAVVSIMTSVVDDSGVPNTGIGAPAQRPEFL